MMLGKLVSESEESGIHQREEIEHLSLRLSEHISLFNLSITSVLRACVLLSFGTGTFLSTVLRRKVWAQC